MDAGEVSAGRGERGWSGHWSAPGGDQVCSSRADLAHAADVGDPHSHGVGAAAPEALSGIHVQSHILGFHMTSGEGSREVGRGRHREKGRSAELWRKRGKGKRKRL